MEVKQKYTHICERYNMVIKKKGGPGKHPRNDLAARE
jgi:hypothetical protein